MIYDAKRTYKKASIVYQRPYSHNLLTNSIEEGVKHETPPEELESNLLRKQVISVSICPALSLKSRIDGIGVNIQVDFFEEKILE